MFVETGLGGVRKVRNDIGSCGELYPDVKQYIEEVRKVSILVIPLFSPIIFMGYPF